MFAERAVWLSFCAHIRRDVGWEVRSATSDTLGVLLRVAPVSSDSVGAESATEVVGQFVSLVVAEVENTPGLGHERVELLLFVWHPGEEGRRRASARGRCLVGCRD